MTFWGHGVLGLSQSYDATPETLKAARDAGARIYRHGGDMTAGNLITGLQAQTDRVRAAGLESLICVTYSPPQLGEYHQVPLTGAKRQVWAGMVGDIAKALKGRVRAYEIWNEPNHGPYFNIKPNLANYVDLLNRTYAAIKAADPAALVITGGTSPRSTDADGFAPVDWVTGLYSQKTSAGRPIKPRMNGVGHHPYSYPWPASTVADWNAAWRTKDIAAVVQWCDTSLGIQPRPVWATEVCFPSKSSGARDPYVDEAVQAQRLDDLVKLWRSWSWSGPLVWFGVHDNPSDADPAMLGALCRSDGSPKPSLAKFRQLAG